MSLGNLLKTGQLKSHCTDPVEVQRLLAAAARNLADSEVLQISAETRFDAAYKSIMQCALLGLMASGYRPSTNMPGHHQTMIQLLELTLELPKERWLVLDVLRRKRNINDYSGDLMEASAVVECVQQARALLEWTRHWLMRRHPALLQSADSL